MSGHVVSNAEVQIDKNSRAYQQRWLGMLFIGISLLVISLDNTILNVALPEISIGLGASASDLQWIVDAYILVFAALLLTMGSIGDRYGRKLWLQVGLALFGVGSLAAALSDNTNMLIASRAFLGIGAATIMPATLSLITATFPKEERSQAIAAWAAVFGLGVGIGPVTGGVLLEHYEWNAVFFVNLPVIVIALVGGQYYLAESRDPNAPPIDIPGVILSIAGLFALIYGIIEAGAIGWTDDKVVMAFGAAVVLLGLFAIWESRTKYPMLPLYFFRNFSFTGANTALAFIMFSLFGSIFFMSQFLQTVQGYTPLETGLRILPMALTLAVTSALSARISQRLGVKLTVTLGMLIGAGGLFFMSQTIEPDSAYSTVVLGLMMTTGGLGLAVSPATDSVMGSVPPSKAGVGSAMNDTTRELGGAMGVAVLGTVMNSHYISGLDGLHEQLPAEFPASFFTAIEDSIQAAHIIAARLPEMAAQQGLTLPDAMATQFGQTIIDSSNVAFTDGMTTAMLIGSCVMFAGAMITLAILPNQAKAESKSQDIVLPEGLEAAAGD